MHTGMIVGGKYRLSREIGQGSMGSVWAAVHTLLDREVAIKFLNPSFEDPTTAAARFVAEAKAAALVKHRFVVDVFDFGITESGGISYMVQELLSGEPLSELMCEGPTFALGEAVRFMMDCLSGLAAVHERGLIHRDLKPENIFVLRDSEGLHPKLLDFGISKSADAPRDKRVPRPSLRTSGRTRLTAVGSTLGTPAYMSPEQLRNLSTLDARADLYSLGVVFYEWLVGHCPFATTMNFAVLVDRIEARQMQPLEELRPDLGAALCAVIARAIEPDRSARYASALEMRSALAEVLERVPSVQTRMQNELPVYVPKGLPPPSITYRPRSGLSEGVISLRPAGLRRAPSRGFWLGAVAVGLVLAAAPIAWRARSHDSHNMGQPQRVALAGPRVAPEPATGAPEALELAPARGVEDLPLGALPPESDKPAALDESRAALGSSEDAPSRHRHHRHHARSTAAADSSHAPARASTDSSHAPARASTDSSHAPARASTLASSTVVRAHPATPLAGQNKLLRSLDF